MLLVAIVRVSPVRVVTMSAEKVTDVRIVGNALMIVVVNVSFVLLVPEIWKTPVGVRLKMRIVAGVRNAVIVIVLRVEG